MTDNHPRSSDASGTEDAPHSDNDSSLEALREILLSRYLQRVSDLEAELDDVERRITDEEALIATISPVMGDAIRRKIRDARREMVEALYPIIGQVVVRAVSEAVRDLARTVDAQVRTSFSPRAMWWRLRARMGGASAAEASLREVLPFEVAEVFLIHRETGLLLRHISREAEPSPDSDLISSMLTAIRDFAQDAFGQGGEAELDEIEYGGRRILIEAAEHAYLAVVVDGVEPPGFRAAMRERIIEVEHAHQQALRHYDGDPAPLASVEEPLRSLMAAARPSGLSPVQKRVLVGALGLMFVCVVAACMAGRWALQTMRPIPTATALPVATQVPPSATPTAAPSATPSPTLTPTPSPTLTPTATATPTPAPVVGVMTGHVWVRQDPRTDAPFLGLILERGQRVEILAVFGDWCRVRWIPQAQSEVTGWVPLQWVGTMAPIPDRVITPATGF